MKKSLLISWISCCDYPLFRAWLEKYYVFFDEIIIYWDLQFKFPFFNAFIQQSLARIPNIRFLDHVERDYGSTDWRQVATTELVRQAHGDWIISIEQDWFAKDWPKLLATLEVAMEENELIGWMNPTNAPYVHPAFFAIKRDLLKATTQDFSAHPEINGSDHFATITYDAQRLGAKIMSLQDLGFNCDFNPISDMFHLGGVNQNYLEGLKPGFAFHRGEAFAAYNYECRFANTVQDTKFLYLSGDIETQLVKLYPNLNLKDNEYTPFFKI